MSRSSKLRVLSYDISDKRRRRRVAALLEAEATRVQYSVFEGRLTDAELNRLESQIECEISEGDSLRIYTVGVPGEKHSRVVGQGIPVDADKAFWLL